MPPRISLRSIRATILGMPALVAGIPSLRCASTEDVVGRNKSGHDGERCWRHFHSS
jgi:hypothetical protein